MGIKSGTKLICTLQRDVGAKKRVELRWEASEITPIISINNATEIKRIIKYTAHVLSLVLHMINGVTYT